LVDQHMSSKQIARELGMSKTSVDTYCDRARRKLGVDDRYQAARLLARHDVLTASGQDAIRTDSRPASWPHGDELEGRAHGHLGASIHGGRRAAQGGGPGGS